MNPVHIFFALILVYFVCIVFNRGDKANALNWFFISCLIVSVAGCSTWFVQLAFQ